MDYRKFNDVTVKEAQVPSRIDDILNHFGGAQYFSTIDLYKAYWQILMAKESRKYTAFMTHKGHFQFKRMSFGLTNAPAWFQRFMMKVLQPFLNKFAMVYLDDIVVFSKTKEEHREHLRLVFQALEDYNLKVSAEKCFLFQDKIKILGFYASKDGITSDPEKVEAIKAMASPNNVKQVRRFLGMTGYYRRLIDDYGRIAGPLTKLTNKFVKFEWSPECEDSFQKLKERLCKDPIVNYPNPDKPYKLYTDACDYAIGAILVQEDENGMERPIEYLAKQIPKSGLKWPTIQKEAFAIAVSLIKFNHYLHAAKVEVLTDHKPCLALFKGPIKNIQIQRWQAEIQALNATISYRKGAHNIRADMLSRLHGGEIGKDILKTLQVDVNKEICTNGVTLENTGILNKMIQWTWTRILNNRFRMSDRLLK